MSKSEVELWGEYVRDFKKQWRFIREFNAESRRLEQKDWEGFNEELKKYDKLPWYKRMVATHPMDIHSALLVGRKHLPEPQPTLEGFMNWQHERLVKPKRRKKS